MHIRTSRVRRNGKTYEYAQLVEAYRRESDGMPVHRVLATFRDAITAQNFRDALTAARGGKRVAVARQSPTRALKPLANLRYLDLAVLLELWRESGAAAMIEDLMPAGDAAVSPASVVAALTLQRCVDPGSKLYASRWFPRTALPELLEIAPDTFNNTRLHRVLDELDNVTGALMAKVSAHHAASEGTFASLFMDVSDAWFVGEGPTMARLGKTKEGLVQRKIGILLLCNEHGYPLRWEVIEGTLHDSVAMSRMFSQIAAVSWAQQTPVVCDRAMGNTAQIRHMLGTGLHFLTALNVSEFDAYAPRIPYPPFAAFDASDDVQAIARCAEHHGMQRIQDDLYVLDMGSIQRDDDIPVVGAAPVEDLTVMAMRLCREIRLAVAQGIYPSLRAAGRAAGLRRTTVTKYCSLAALSEAQQRDVLEGKVRASLAQLLGVTSIRDSARRADAFQALVLSTSSKPTAPRPRASATPGPPTCAAPIRVRTVAHFNPEMLLHQRQRAREQLQAIEDFASELNAKAQAPHSRLTPHAVGVLIDQRLRKDGMLDIFDVRIAQPPNQPLHIQLVLDKAKWARRRRFDGFSVLIAHPDLPHTAEQLALLYRAKDAVEKDFHVIKSVVDVRPVRHRNDAKVRAHVTLCMLALMLERMLTRRLAKHPDSAETALETLASCHLNLFKGQLGPAAYAITHPSDEQHDLLRALKMLHLADDEHLAQNITPR